MDLNKSEIDKHTILAFFDSVRWMMAGKFVPLDG